MTFWLFVSNVAQTVSELCWELGGGGVTGLNFIKIFLWLIVMKNINALESSVCKKYELVHNIHHANVSLCYYFSKLN